MTVPFSFRLAWREGRSSLRRIGVYMASITLGVAALVAVHSFRGDITRSIRQESRSLLGADLRLASSAPFADSIVGVVDSLEAGGARVARVTSLVSMVLAEPSEATRLLQVQGVEEGYPFYGSVTTDPPGLWGGLATAGGVLVDEAVLIQLAAGVGDTLVVGRARLPILGSVDGLPTDIGFQAAVGPRVYVAREALEDTGLLTFGSLVRHQAFLRLPEGADADGVEDRYRELFRRQLVSATSADEQAEDLTEGTRILSRFLGLIGLAALLLGGIGVGSAIHVFVKEKLTAVAVLRCLGARQRSVFAAYLLQSAVLGVVGAAAGVLLGLGIQRLLPRFVADLLPVTVGVQVDPWAVAAGLAVGVWVAMVFALIPLLAVRDVTPLLALRRDFEPEPSRGNRARIFTYGALVASIVLLSVWEAPTPPSGLAFAASLAAALGVLWLAAALLVRLTRRYFPRRASYPVRQGVANLFRPQNQTVAVTIALGFGAFLIGSVLLVQESLQNQLALDEGGRRPNLLLFDVQTDQQGAVVDLVEASAEGPVEVTPVVPARIAAINGVPATDVLADTSDARPERWAVRRLYRNTYRAHLTPSEELVEGHWWDAGSDRAATEAAGSGPEELPRISVEIDLASDLRVEPGDEITWDVQGVRVRTRVASLRRVDWARFEPNFFVVFEPGVIDDAPQTLLALARVPSPESRAAVQRDLVRAFPNVSVLDLSLVLEALETIVGRVSQAIRFLAGFSVLGGIMVLIGSLTTSRFQRMREGALLKTLGARRAQVVKVLVTEYLSLGLLSAVTGLLLATAGAWGLVTFLFDGTFDFRIVPMLVLGLVVVVLTVLIGALNSRGVLSRPPLAVLREVGE